MATNASAYITEWLHYNSTYINFNEMLEEKFVHKYILMYFSTVNFV